MAKRKLSSKVHDQITRLSRSGDALAKKKEYDAALQKYREAWELVPEDKENWEASTWLLASAGDVFFEKRDFETALNRFRRAVQCPQGLGNPYIHLRIGELHFELGEREASKDELARAWMGGGDRLFREEDPKYLKFVRTFMRPPEAPRAKKVPVKKKAPVKTKAGVVKRKKTKKR